MLLEKDFGAHVPSAAYPRHIPIWQQCLNVLCCFLSIPIYFLMTVSSHYPITLDMLLTIILAELNRFFNQQRREKLQALNDQDESPVREKEDWLKWELNVEKAAPRLDCMAAVVGWREDPDLFSRALESYKATEGCTFLLVGVDGDEAEDQDMVDVFNQVRIQALSAHAHTAQC